MRSLRFATLSILGAWLLVGVVWLVSNLGQVPHYADMRGDPSSTLLRPAGYLRLAEDGTADPRRGLAYPVVLRGVHDVVGGPWRDGAEPEVRNAVPTETIECWAPGWYSWVQWLQLLIGAVALTWAVSVFAAATGLGEALGRSRARLVIGFVVALGLLDPMVAHAHLSLMPTAFALQALLVFAAAWVSLARGTRVGLAWVLIPASQLLAGMLRPEKGLVMLVAGLVTGLGLTVLCRADRSARRRCGVALVLVVVAYSVTAHLNARALAVPNAWTIQEIVAHSRVIYPNLERSWEALSPATQAILSRQDAGKYDISLPHARQMMHQLCGNDQALRQQITNDMLAAVWKTMPAGLIGDALRDSTIYAFPTLPAYFTWVEWRLAGTPIELLGQRRYESVYILGLVAFHRPWMSNLYLAGSAVLAALLALGLLAIVLFGRRRLATAGLRLPGVVVVPFGAVWLVNALAFGLSQKLFEIRYVLISHALAVMITGGLALAFVLIRPSRR